MNDGKVLYTILCNDIGGCIDDLLVYRFESSPGRRVCDNQLFHGPGEKGGSAIGKEVRIWYDKEADYLEVFLTGKRDTSEKQRTTLLWKKLIRTATFSVSRF